MLKKVDDLCIFMLLMHQLIIQFYSIFTLKS